GAALGLVASMWTKIKGLAWRLTGLLVQRVEVPTEQGHEALVAFLVANFERSKNYDKMYGASWEYQRDGRYGLIPYEVFGNRALILWNGWFPFLFTNQVESKAASGRGGSSDTASGGGMKIHSTLIYLRGTLDVEQLLRAACAARNNISWAVEDQQTATKNRFCIHHVPARTGSESDWTSGSDGLAWYQQGNYRLLAHTPEQLGKARASSGKALDSLIFPQRVKDLIKEIELWRKSKAWYLEKGIPWKRGMLLYGPPGTGKTALARAFAEDLNMPIYVYNLAEMGNHDLIKAWTEMQTNTPCIALIEDIDNVFHGRDNVVRRPSLFPMMPPEKKDGDSGDGDKPRGPLAPLTFDCLLNCLDGVERADGIFTIISTNDLSKIDPALGLPRQLPDGTTEFISTRPGRIDKAVELTYMEAADKKRMAGKILGAYEKEHLEVLEFVDRFPDLQETPAQFQERCAQVALKCFWRESGAGEAREAAGDGAFARMFNRLMGEPERAQR
ncbi:MAG: AAA family ATPase, partial [Gemmata sp.]